LSTEFFERMTARHYFSPAPAGLFLPGTSNLSVGTRQADARLQGRRREQCSAALIPTFSEPLC
jgi:hypothetical protein